MSSRRVARSSRSFLGESRDHPRREVHDSAGVRRPDDPWRRESRAFRNSSACTPPSPTDSRCSRSCTTRARPSWTRSSPRSRAKPARPASMSGRVPTPHQARALPLWWCSGFFACASISHAPAHDGARSQTMTERTTRKPSGCVWEVLLAGKLDWRLRSERTDRLRIPPVGVMRILPRKTQRENDRGRFNISSPSDASVDPTDAALWTDIKRETTQSKPVGRRSSSFKSGRRDGYETLSGWHPGLGS